MPVRGRDLVPALFIAMNELSFGTYHRLCTRCRIPHIIPSLVNGVCENCRDALNAIGQRELAMSDQRAVAQASRSLITHLNRMGDESAVMPAVGAAFLKEIGGMEHLGKSLAEDFRRVRGECLTEEEARTWDRRDGNIIKMYTLVTGLLQKLDENKKVDVSGLTDEDLNTALADVAAKLISADPVFRDRIINEAMSNDPNLRQRVMEMNGNTVVPPSQAPPAQALPEPDYDEVSHDE